MKYLLDTNIALWLFEGDDGLSQTARDIIYDAGNEIYISIASAWEVAIKTSINKLDFEGGVSALLTAIEANNIDLLGVKGEHLKIVEKLPLIHRDPFDRLIVSAAFSESMTVMTSDENIANYAVPCIRS